MTGLIVVLVYSQATGAIVGAIMAMWSEFAYLRAIRDGNVDGAERAHLNSIALGLRIGMSVLLVSSVGLVVTAYLNHSTIQPALTPAYWTLIMFALLIVGVTWALSRGKISFAFGSGIVFTTWWLLVYMTLGWLAPTSFGSSVAMLIVGTAVVCAIFYYIRYLATVYKSNKST